MTDTPVSRPISCRRKLLTPWLLLMAGVLPGFGDVSLLTGDANNHIYNSAAAICDLSADGDLVLFSTSPPPAPGITKAGLYVRRISTNTLTYVDDPAHPSNIESTFSDDGRYIAWVSVDNFIYWHDVQTKVTRLINSNWYSEGRLRDFHRTGQNLAPPRWQHDLQNHLQTHGTQNS